MSPKHTNDLQIIFVSHMPALQALCYLASYLPLWTLTLATQISFPLLNYQIPFQLPAICPAESPWNGQFLLAPSLSHSLHRPSLAELPVDWLSVIPHSFTSFAALQSQGFCTRSLLMSQVPPLDPVSTGEVPCHFLHLMQDKNLIKINMETRW